MNKLRIAIINDQPRSSGTGTYAWHLAESLVTLADHIYLDYPSRRVVVNPGTPSESVMAKLVHLPLIDNRPWFWRRTMKHVKGYDIYHFTSQNMSFLCGTNKKKTIVTCHDIIPVIEPDNFLEGYWRGYLYSGLKRADRIITVSEVTKHDLVTYYNLPENKIESILEGVGAEYRPRDKAAVRQQLGLPGDRHILLHVGTAARRKRIPLLLEAFAASQIRKEAILIRIGKTTAVHRQLAGKLGILGQVLFLENVPGDQLPLYYSAADLFVFPSSYEGFGLPSLEAMASGCPVIAADNSSIPEVVGEAGVLVRSDDPIQWAAVFDKVLGDPDRAIELSRRGIARAGQFTWERMAQATFEEYKIVINR